MSALKLYYTPMDDCDVCGKNEDSPRDDPDNQTYLSVIQLRGSHNRKVINLCWECLGPVVEELCENPPE